VVNVDLQEVEDAIVEAMCSFDGVSIGERTRINYNLALLERLVKLGGLDWGSRCVIDSSYVCVDPLNGMIWTLHTSVTLPTGETVVVDGRDHYGTPE
jgi:hypothetical protein